MKIFAITTSVALAVSASALQVANAAPAKKPWPLPIEVNVNDTPIKDLRNSSSAPDLGYAGAMLEVSTLVAEWFYISNRVESGRKALVCERYMAVWFSLGCIKR